MGGNGDSKRQPKRLIDADAKARFLAGLRLGMARDAAAAQAGFTSQGFYYAGRRDGVFKLAWVWALELSAADARGASPLALAPGEVEIVANRARPLQSRPARRTRFDDRRKRIFLDHFAGTADAHQAAAAAGIAYPTFTQHRRKDAGFAAACDDALAVAYAALEAEAVRQRLKVQRDLREGLCPTGEIAREFERVMQLLARYDRRGGRIGFRAISRGGERRWSFEESIELLDRHLRALGARHGVVAEPIRLPPPSGAGGEE
jgi:hypothetical protein